jgi:hypothetical protein
VTRVTEREVAVAKVKLAGVLLLCAVDAVILVATRWAA